MSTANTTEQKLQNWKKDLTALEKDFILEKGKLEQEEAKMVEMGFNSIEELDAAIAAKTEELAQLEEESRQLMTSFEETYADYI